MCQFVRATKKIDVSLEDLDKDRKLTRDLLIILVTNKIYISTDTTVYEGLNDPLEIVRIIKENPKLGFLYLTPAVPKSSIKYHPYNLKVVAHNNINNQDFYTISQTGALMYASMVSVCLLPEGFR